MIQKVKPFTSKADLHVHTKYSDKPTEWFLKRIGAPECFVEPKDVYKSAKSSGMQYVTISDHNTINGALEIAHLPDTFISVELTCRFPENDAKMHILTTGITEQQFEQLDELRHNIYELREYFHQEDIIYSVAHPLFLVNEKLTLDQFEKLLVLFNRFEIINGTRDPRAAKVTNAILDHLTPEYISKMADKHGIEPFGPAPHLKMKTAGSDDHSGQYVASAFTVTPEAATTQDYLNHIKAGRHEPGGASGNSLHLAHCFYHIAHSFYKQKLLGAGNSSLLGELFKQLLGENKPKIKAPQKEAKKKVLPQKVPGFLQNWLVQRHMKKLSSTERLIVEESQQLLNMDNGDDKDKPAYQQAFDISCRLSHGLTFALVKKTINKASDGDLFKTLEAASATVPIITAIMPYLAAFKTQNKDESFIRKVAGHFEGATDYLDRSSHIGWLSDSLPTNDEVLESMSRLALEAKENAIPLTALYCDNENVDLPMTTRRFDPVGQLKLVEGANKLPFPPFLNVINEIEQRQFKELILSTPGPMGLIGLFAARMFHLKTVAIAHSHWGEEIRFRTEDYGLENFGNKYTSWFYSQCDRVLVHSEKERQALILQGVSEDKIEYMPRGVDAIAKAAATKGYWQSHEAEKSKTILLRGPVDKHANLEVAIEAFQSLATEYEDWQIVVVGEGQRFKKLKNKYQSKQVHWLKKIDSSHLPSALKSSHLYIDLRNMKGNSRQLIEAMAAELPYIVNKETAAADWCEKTECGVSISIEDSTPKKIKKHLIDAMSSYMSDMERLKTHGKNAGQLAGEMNWQTAAEVLFQSSSEPAHSSPNLDPNRPAALV